MYSTGVGLILYGAEQSDQRLFRARDENIYGKVRKRMGAWLQEVL
jgi:cell division protein FtsA